mmetsp:Transcript_46089/g.128179  ORF Transcript_46089/g.128179 Transcript_46089/m.128179 type:complete len:234 (-) Transcript_46089:1193-1894(-)
MEVVYAGDAELSEAGLEPRVLLLLGDVPALPDALCVDLHGLHRKCLYRGPQNDAAAAVRARFEEDAIAGLRVDLFAPAIAAAICAPVQQAAEAPGQEDGLRVDLYSPLILAELPIVDDRSPDLPKDIGAPRVAQHGAAPTMQARSNECGVPAAQVHNGVAEDCVAIASEDARTPPKLQFHQGRVLCAWNKEEEAEEHVQCLVVLGHGVRRSGLGTSSGCRHLGLCRYVQGLLP